MESGVNGEQSESNPWWMMSDIRLDREDLVTDQFLFDNDMDLLQDLCRDATMLRPWQFKLLGKLGKDLQDSVLESHQDVCDYLKFRNRLDAGRKRKSMMRKVALSEKVEEGLDDGGGSSSEEEPEDAETARVRRRAMARAKVHSTPVGGDGSHSPNEPGLPALKPTRRPSTMAKAGAASLLVGGVLKKRASVFRPVIDTAAAPVRSSTLPPLAGVAEGGEEPAESQKVKVPASARSRASVFQRRKTKVL